MRSIRGQRDARLVLSRLAEPYDERVQDLVARYGVEEIARAAVGSGAMPGGLDRLRARRERLSGIDEDAVAAALDARILVPGDEEWPEALDELPWPPWCLWVRGPVRLDRVPSRSVAVVGSRASTAYGDEMAARLTMPLAERGVAVVSGAAYGIDAAAHRAALSADGVTVAALAGGVDVVYPRSNSQLIGEIAERGALVSETPPGGAPARMRFLARNRIIAAVSTGTVLVEAGLRSGARSTVRWARDLGRPVMAVPGPVTSLQSEGCHEELRMDAVVVTRPEEVAEMIGGMGRDMAPPRHGPVRDGDDLPDDQRRVWQWLRPRRAVTVDELMARAGLDLAEVLTALAVLEERGLATELLDGWIARSES